MTTTTHPGRPTQRLPDETTTSKLGWTLLMLSLAMTVVQAQQPETHAARMKASSSPEWTVPLSMAPFILMLIFLPLQIVSFGLLIRRRKRYRTRTHTHTQTPLSGQFRLREP
jgi:hypothetical protein